MILALFILPGVFAFAYLLGLLVIGMCEGPDWDRSVPADPSANTRPMPDAFGRMED